MGQKKKTKKKNHLPMPMIAMGSGGCGAADSPAAAREYLPSEEIDDVPPIET
jgi:hypothetical protein